MTNTQNAKFFCMCDDPVSMCYVYSCVYGGQTGQADSKLTE